MIYCTEQTAYKTERWWMVVLDHYMSFLQFFLSPCHSVQTHTHYPNLFSNLILSIFHILLNHSLDQTHQASGEFFSERSQGTLWSVCLIRNSPRWQPETHWVTECVALTVAVQRLRKQAFCVSERSSHCWHCTLTHVRGLRWAGSEKHRGQSSTGSCPALSRMLYRLLL